MVIVFVLLAFLTSKWVGLWELPSLADLWCFSEIPLVFLGSATVIPALCFHYQKSFIIIPQPSIRSVGKKIFEYALLAITNKQTNKKQTKRTQKTNIEKILQCCVSLLTLEYFSGVAVSFTQHPRSNLVSFTWELFISHTFCVRNHTRYQGLKDELTWSLPTRDAYPWNKVTAMMER